MNTPIPVLTIDGPSGSGKGTVSRAVAQKLGWHFLDSGAIYRSLAIAVLRAGIPVENVDEIVALAENMNLSFTTDDPPEVLLNGQDIAGEIGSETCGNAASRIAAFGPVRQALLEKQRSFRRPPGLVADGRDMGTVVFQDAGYKVFLTASAEVRALRRYKQLKDKGLDVNLINLTREIEERDRRDLERKEAPLVMAKDAVRIDSSDLDIQQVIERVFGVVASPTG
ncbi:MAG: (d)CMP kinase [Methylococcaceae bacterium]|nr:(d)CMP kinase [Methylococcaceae bacterium]